VPKRAIPIFYLCVIILILSGLATAGVFAAPASSSATSSAPGINPYSPAYQHSYRHGVVPTIARLGKMKAYQLKQHTASSNTLTYGGGIDNTGVTSGTEQVYLVFWGTQWGTQGTDGNGNFTFSSDTAGAAPYVQNLLKGLGTGGELWSGTMTQYCDGPNVSRGATSCPSNAAHVGYPAGGVLAGVWYDNSGPEPEAATYQELAGEAIAAAGYFGKTTPASNRYAQYIIFSATGTNPDNYLNSGFCAWHDYYPSSYGDIAFTNLPYLLDVGSTCGENFVNSGSAGTLDGFSIVEGHEYAETITDQNPAGGWTNPYTGEEDGDECAWIGSGQGAAADVAMGNGSYAMQSTWSNDTKECDISHPVVTSGSSNDFSINANPGSLTIAQGSSRTSTISTAVTSGQAGTVNLSASVSPPGPTASLSPTSVTAGSSSTLTVSVGSKVAPGSYTVTVTGTEGSTQHSTSVSVTATASSGGGIVNGGFETGTFYGWTTSGKTSISTTAHSGKHSARVGATTPTNGSSSIKQTFTAPSGTSTLTFWYLVHCPDTVQHDWATATLKDNTTGKTITILPNICTNKNTWVKVTASVTAGHSYTLTLISHDDNRAGNATYTLFDDVALN
jgi:hypothetical protein